MPFSTNLFFFSLHEAESNFSQLCFTAKRKSIGGQGRSSFVRNRNFLRSTPLPLAISELAYVQWFIYRGSLISSLQCRLPALNYPTIISHTHLIENICNCNCTLPHSTECYPSILRPTWLNYFTHRSPHRYSMAKTKA